MTDRRYDWGDPPRRQLDLGFWLFVICWTAAMCGAAIVGGWR